MSDQTGDKPSSSRHRGHNEGSVYQTKDGSWRGAVSLGYGPDGKPRRKYVSGRTRAEVNRKVTRLLNSDQQGIPVATDVPTVARFLTSWLEDVVKPDARARTYETYEGVCRRHLIPSLGRHRIDKLTAQHIQAMLAAKRAAGLKGSTLLHMRTILRIALSQAVRWDLVARNVAALTDPPKTESYEPNPLPPAEVAQFLEHVAGDRDEALYVVAVMLGLRQAELLGLSWGDVDLAKGTLRVRRQLQWSADKPRRPLLVEPKTDRSKRQLPLPPDVLDTLRRHRTRQLEERLRAGGHWSTDLDLVFPSPTGTPLDASALTKRFQARLDAAGLERRRFHDLRHTSGSFLTARGVHPRLIMEILGHSRIATTMNTYAHVELDSLRDALAHVSEFYPPEAK
jgi:integrase